MMRFVLVILFFVTMSLVLRPTPPADLQTRRAQDAQITAEANRQSAAAEQAAAARLETSPDATAAASTDTATQGSSPPDGQQTDLRPGELDKPGEERTSSSTAQSPNARDRDIEAGIQSELTRLACYYGKPEKSWGRRSQTAIRRFAVKAKLKAGTAPTQSLLTTMRGYPANYCRTGGSRKR